MTFSAINFYCATEIAFVLLCWYSLKSNENYIALSSSQ